MKINKKIISDLERGYSIAPLYYNQKNYVLVASEISKECLLFDLEGNQVDVIWDEPGGVMSMVQVPNTDGQFLATQQFYSPNESKEAKIVIVTPTQCGRWEVRTLVDIPHVHRFDIITAHGVNYLIVCTLKSGHDYEEDWSKPGKIYVSVLPDDLSSYGENNQLELTVLKDGLLKNHGYYKRIKQNNVISTVATENGVFQLIPPLTTGEEWQVKLLLDVAASEALLLDFDGDGIDELAVFAPFHGDEISIYKVINGKYEKVYQFEESVPLLHAICGGDFCGKPTLIVGHRQGKRNLMAFTFNCDTGEFQCEILDEDCGSANVFKYAYDGKEILIATNREINEVAMYTCEM